ncbi:MAG TPA: hypothetical protein VME18_00065 [Acidobacteriaceae bacterium]|nr:hypothetical protein [Acidobacteriaceae bacterium]
MPHGNSVLALGSVDLNDGDDFDGSLDGLNANPILAGAPAIPDGPVPYPRPADIATPDYLDVYATLLNTPADYENPNPIWARNPSRPLQLAMQKLVPKCFIHWNVTTLPLPGGKGSVTNVPFEQRKSKVTDYWADYWLLSQEPYVKGGPLPNFNCLAYTQTIMMEMTISVDKGKESRKFIFPHVTCNTVKKLPGTPSQARNQYQNGTPPCIQPK